MQEGAFQVRQVDGIGRVVVPISMRRDLGMAENTPIGISVDGDRIVLEVARPCCVFCRGTEGVRELMGRKVCQSCVEGLAAAAGRLN